MLQFIAQTSDTYSIPEQVQMALEGGAQWIVIDGKGLDETQQREAVRDSAELCREAGSILVFDGNPEIAREAGIHGVELHGALSVATNARNSLGAEAIIGMDIDKASTAVRLADMDIDYAVLDCSLGTETIRGIIHEIRQAGCHLPVVVRGEYTSDNIQEALDLGANGVATGKLLMQTENPVEAVNNVIKALLGN